MVSVAGFNASIAGVWAAGIPFYGVVGNHDWMSGDVDFSNYLAFFDFSAVVDEPYETELHYSFDYEGLHFIILNTEDYLYDPGGLGPWYFNCSATQMTFLLEDLKETQPEDFIVATFHRPAWSITTAYSPGRWVQAEAVRDHFHDLFVQYGVDLVFSGHDHYYYQTERNGTYYFTTGGGGAELYDFNLSAPIWKEGDMAFSEYHFCQVEVYSTYVEIVAIDPNNTIRDIFRIERTTTPTIQTPPTLPPPSLEALLLISTVVFLSIALIFAFIMLRSIIKEK